ncbi:MULTISPECIES: heavy-metal-associated domain-containing protein [Pseudanabaena]|jgi:copper chaperone|uniref:heavy-metal-associated domain-containing protein n=1 Tax=Pseudanabaena TaxID=1152 RepID=UPI002479FCC2|nr:MULTISPECIES: heavy-metal-associated domain-containing protein [Pseudanabaena]MEA5486746.1 heavy-metal-associated domain-containing protein [Pseudanabaena sp. CCNP1317]WGS71103.1 heavy-metal-associated domain-containing protein [Pseudanabaena galeata CCNP1313]
MNLTLSVPSIGCASCIETITKAIQTVDTSAIVTGDAATKSLDIESQLTEVKIRELIAIAGHKVA